MLGVRCVVQFPPPPCCHPPSPLQCYDLIVAASRQAIAFLQAQLIAVGLEIEQVRCVIDIASLNKRWGNKYN